MITEEKLNELSGGLMVIPKNDISKTASDFFGIRPDKMADLMASAEGTVIGGVIKGSNNSYIKGNLRVRMKFDDQGNVKSMNFEKIKKDSGKTWDDIDEYHRIDQSKKSQYASDGHIAIED